jgi:cytochrome c oxidase subunit IV
MTSSVIQKPHEHKSHVKEYMAIFFLLGLFTLIEIWVPSIQSLSQIIKGVILTILASIKAWMVAFYYMHLKDEKTWLKIIAAIPLSAVAYAYFLVLESLFR